MKNLDKRPESFDDEIWKDLPEYENYQVSNYCRFKRKLIRKIVIRKNGQVVNYHKKSEILNQFLSQKGYLRVSVTKNRKQILLTTHRVMAELFIDNPEKYPQLNHKDGNKINNMINNLEWCNNSMNMSHAFKLGLNTPNFGSKNGNSKLLEEDVIRIKKLLLSGNRICEINRIFPKIHKSTISYIKNGKLWAHVVV